MTEIKCETCQGTGRDHLHIWDIGPPIDYFHCETCVGYGTLNEVKRELNETPYALTANFAYLSLLLDNY